MADAIDVALREQIYFEGVKANEADKADDLQDEIAAAIIGALLALGITQFTSKMTKRRFDELVRHVRAAMTAILVKNNGVVVDSVQTVLAVLVKVQTSNAKLFSALKITKKSFNGTKGGNAKLYNQIMGELMPATGLTPKELIVDFNRSVMNQTVKIIKQAYADKLSIADTLKLVKGTPQAAYKDGMLNKVRNQYRAMSNTLLQHVKAWLAHEIGKMLFPKYQWISTIDAVTTHICRGRHLKIYSYGNGPRPPAHYNCRSIIVGITGDLSNMAPRSYWEWIKRQPAEFLKSVLTQVEADAIKNGDAKASDHNSFKNIRKLTPTQFGKLLPKMQA
jgi:SPP1 gp7 family putative phage head morphogenesis protein